MLPSDQDERASVISIARFKSAGLLSTQHRLCRQVNERQLSGSPSAIRNIRNGAQSGRGRVGQRSLAQDSVGAFGVRGLRASFDGSSATAALGLR
ncbi:MAG: hypothetical protein ABI196_04625, partial [Bradyrhizobium sp.]